MTALADVLALPCPQGYVRVFADEGPPMAALLGRLIAAQRTGRAAAEIPLGYLARLQRAFGPGGPARDPVPSGIVDPLTSRELEVARLICDGLTSHAIASRLSIAPRTATAHVENIRRKLEVRSRAQIAAWITEHRPAAERRAATEHRPPP